MGMFQAVVNSIFEAGVNNQLLTAVNIVFVSLVLVTLTMFLLVGFNVHLLVMVLLSTGLLLSVNWFAHELSNAKGPPSSDENNKNK